MGPTDQQVTAGEKVLLECTTTLGSGGFQPLIGWSRKGEGIKLHTCWYITYGLFTYITHQTDVDLWFFDDSSSCIQVLVCALLSLGPYNTGPTQQRCTGVIVLHNAPPQ